MDDKTTKETSGRPEEDAQMGPDIKTEDTEPEAEKDAPDASDATKKDKPKKEKKSKSKETIDRLEAEVLSFKDKYLRSVAELENVKKRMIQERINDRKYASKALIESLLEPLEQLDRIVSMPTDNDLLKNFLIGFKMVNDRIYDVLALDGLKEIDALSKPFDPTLHMAIEKAHDPEKDNGINLDVIRKGYTYKDQLLRPAMVKVNEWSEDNHGKEQ